MVDRGIILNGQSVVGMWDELRCFWNGLTI